MTMVMLIMLKMMIPDNKWWYLVITILIECPKAASSHFKSSLDHHSFHIVVIFDHRCQFGLIRVFIAFCFWFVWWWSSTRYRAFFVIVKLGLVHIIVPFIIYEDHFVIIASHRHIVIASSYMIIYHQSKKAPDYHSSVEACPHSCIPPLHWSIHWSTCSPVGVFVFVDDDVDGDDNHNMMMKI